MQATIHPNFLVYFPTIFRLSAAFLINVVNIAHISFLTAQSEIMARLGQID